MISAFGVEHNEFSKGLPKGLKQVAGKLKTVPHGTKSQRLADRISANKAGKTAAKLYARGNDLNAGIYMSQGRRARYLSRGGPL